MLRIKGRLDRTHQSEIITRRSPNLTALLDGDRGPFNDSTALPARYTPIQSQEVRDRHRQGWTSSFVCLAQAAE